MKNHIPTRRLLRLGGTLLAAALLAAALAGTGCSGSRVQTTASGYYTGPLHSKTKPGVYGDQDGRRVHPPV